VGGQVKSTTCPPDCPGDQDGRAIKSAADHIRTKSRSIRKAPNTDATTTTVQHLMPGNPALETPMPKRPKSKRPTASGVRQSTFSHPVGSVKVIANPEACAAASRCRHSSQASRLANAVCHRGSASRFAHPRRWGASRRCFPQAVALGTRYGPRPPVYDRNPRTQRLIAAKGDNKASVATPNPGQLAKTRR